MGRWSDNVPHAPVIGRCPPRDSGRESRYIHGLHHYSGDRATECSCVSAVCRRGGVSVVCRRGVAVYRQYVRVSVSVTRVTHECVSSKDARGVAVFTQT